MVLGNVPENLLSKVQSFVETRPQNMVLDLCFCKEDGTVVLHFKRFDGDVITYERSYYTGDGWNTYDC